MADVLEYLGNVKGPAGPEGPPGPPGTNAVANDIAFQAAINSPTSLTFGALDAYTKKTAVRANRTVRVAMGGESHGAGGSQNAPLCRSSGEPLAWAMALSGGRFNYVYNFGLGSSSIASAMVRLQGALDVKPDAVVLLSGTYDLNPSNGVPFSSYQASMAEFVTRVRAIGAVPIIGTAFPSSVAGTSRSNIEKANIWLRQWCGANGVPLLETYNRLIDPATGAIRTSLADSTGVHANPAGNKLIAADLITLLSANLPLWEPPLAGHQTVDSLNMIPNALFLTDTDANGMPDGWAATTGAASGSTVVGAAGEPGNRLKLTSIGDTASILELSAASLPASKWSAGDRVAFCGRFTHTPGAGDKTLNVQLSFTGGTPNSIRALSTWAGAITNGVFYAEDVIPAGTSALAIQMIHNAGVRGAPAVTSELSQLTLLNLTKLGLAVTP